MSKLERFYEEVTEHGGEACLPRNLTDEWLEVVSDAMEALAPSDEGGASEPVPEEAKAVGLAAVLTILKAKKGKPRSIDVDLEQLQEYFTQYRLELALESVHRHTDIKCEPATLKTIFTNREVRTWREPR